jgi:hypothetical protein
MIIITKKTKKKYQQNIRCLFLSYFCDPEVVYNTKKRM